jgi:predicted secreted protein
MIALQLMTVLAPMTQPIESSDMGEESAVHVGELFEIDLEGVPTAGFVWQLHIPSEHAALLELLDSAWDRKGDSIGGTAVQRFRFRALVPGITTLTFGYRRPWEPTDRARRVIRVRIEPPESTREEP